MNNSYSVGKGGDFIKPSARKSIHNHNSYCPFLVTEGMVRYGMDKNTERELQKDNSLNQIYDRDEIDNVFSRPARSSSPLLHKQNEEKRRKSLTPPIQHHLDDSDDDDDNYNRILSTSLPATLPSNLYYSNKIGDLQMQDDHQRILEHSEYTTPQSSIRNKSRSNYSIERPVHISYSPEHELNDNVYQSRQGGNNPYRFITITLIVLISILIYYCMKPQEQIDTIYDESKFYNDIKVLKEKYSINSNSILKIKTGISTIIERQDTASFIIVYNSRSNSFNPATFNNFIKDLSTTAARYLRNDSTPDQPLVVDSSSLNMETHSELINKYRKDVERTGVMLVKELDKVPSVLAMAFHYYCDEYNPLVKKSAIFFTLDKEQCQASPDQKSAHAYIEKCLTRKWNSVPQDNIRPLLARVVSIVVDVTSTF